MSLKNAMAGLSYGGGKAVIFAPDHRANRIELFESLRAQPTTNWLARRTLVGDN